MCLKRQSKKKCQVKSVNTSYLSQHYVTMKTGRLQLEPMGALDTVVILVIAEN